MNPHANLLCLPERSRTLVAVCRPPITKNKSYRCTPRFTAFPDAEVAGAALRHKSTVAPSTSWMPAIWSAKGQTAIHTLGGAMEVLFLGGPADGQTLLIDPGASSWKVPVPNYRPMEYVRRQWSRDIHPQTGEVTYATFFVPGHLGSVQKEGLIRDHLRKNASLSV
jgi:hypothetical protein